MLKENVFHGRRILSAKLNDLDAQIPIIVAATSEELSLPENHFNLTEEEKQLSRLQLFIKKAKMFGFNDKQPATKITGLASNGIVLFGKPQQLAPNSIMQNEEHFSAVKEKAHDYLNRVLKVRTKEGKAETHLSKMTDHLYKIIKKSRPHKGELIHFATMERDLSAPDAGKNRLTAEFSEMLAAELKKKISKNKKPWKVVLDRVLALKQRTSRAESYGIHRIAQQPLILYQSRNAGEEITPKEKVIIIDDHIQVGAAIASSATEIIQSDANLLCIAGISAHKNCHYFNIQQDVKELITALLPNGTKDVPRLNEILKIVGLHLDVLTNVEGLILCAILSDPKNQEHKFAFENLLKKYDASDHINHALFENQMNSLMAEFEKSKIEFSDLEKELVSAVEKGRYTVPYDKQKILSDEDGQNIRKQLDARSALPWLLFDFDDTLHNLNNNTFIFFQHIIKHYSGVEIPLETIKQTRQMLKESGKYQYQEMLLSFIHQCNPAIQVTADDITQAYQKLKTEEPFMPKMSKEDFLALRKKYRIGIITDGTSFESKVSKIKEVYGVDVDGYVNNDKILAKKPSTAMYDEFCKLFSLKEKPVAYVGDSEDLDRGMARNANLAFIHVDAAQPMIDMEKFTNELNAIEERRCAAKMRWNLLRNAVLNKTDVTSGVMPQLLNSRVIPRIK